MVTIRLARHGAKNKPFYHITVAENSAPRDGRFIERIGFYNPVAKGQEPALRVDLARADHWLRVGARPTERVRQLVARSRKEAQAGVENQETGNAAGGAAATPSETPAAA